MKNFIKDYGVLIVALLALVQPWIIAIVKKVKNKPNIEIFEGGRIEIGFSNFGPTLGLFGTLKCDNRELFVKEIQLELTKKKDSSKHLFNWGVFRNERITLSGDQSSFEYPYGFIISRALPKRFNIQFHDLQTQSELREISNKVSSEWLKKLYDLIKKDPQSALSQPPAELAASNFLLYQEFSKEDIHVRSYTAIDRLCYWEVGEYTLIMKVLVSDPDKNFSKTWRFNLTKTDQDIIRLNTVKILQDICGHYSGAQYNFAFTDYMD